MEETNESSSSKHHNSDLKGGSSSINSQNKHIEATDKAEVPLNDNKVSDETDNPLTHNKISGEDDGPLIENNISGEAQDPIVLNKISGEAEDPVDHNKTSDETENPLIHKKISGEVEDPVDHNKISGKTEIPLIQCISGKAENLPIHNKLSGEAEDPQNKISGDASPTSFSSSSQLLELDYDENAFDISFSISEEDEDATNTRQWSMVSASPTAVQASPENASPKQPPVVQAMERTDSYDPNRIPSSTFSRKLTDTTEWSADSNDSLFSIHLGRSGELHRTDSSFRLPTVVETTSEMDQKSTMGEIQNQSDVPVVYSNGNGVNSSEMPSDSITTLPPAPPPPPPPVPEGNVAEETKAGDGVTTPKGRCRCFNCFSCCTFCG